CQQCFHGALIKLITATIAPHSWCDAGSAGTIEFCPLGMSLVVNQTPDVQEQIAGFLENLRRSKSYIPVTTFVTPIFEGGAIGQPVPFTRYVPCPGGIAECGTSAATTSCADSRIVEGVTPAGQCHGVCGVASVPPSFASDLDIPIRKPLERADTTPAHERCYAGGFRSTRGFQFREVVPGTQACQISGSMLLNS